MPGISVPFPNWLRDFAGEADRQVPGLPYPPAVGVWMISHRRRRSRSRPAFEFLDPQRELSTIAQRKGRVEAEIQLDIILSHRLKAFNCIDRQLCTAGSGSA